MLGVMARRSMAILMYEDEAPSYPPGRLNAVRINGAVYIFKRDDGTRRSSVNLPIPAGSGALPAEAGLDRTALRTWFLYKGMAGKSFYTADYLTAASALRVPTPAENPDGNFTRVYDQKIQSYLVEVMAGAITAKTKTGEQVYLVGTRSTFPGPSDTYVRKSQTGYKVLTGLMIGPNPIHGTGQATGDTVQGVASYPAAEVTSTVGAFNLKIRHAGSGGARSTDAGDTVITNLPQKMVVQLGGALFEDLERPATEEEVSVVSEITF
jgi:hypothetical protein